MLRSRLISLALGLTAAAGQAGEVPLQSFEYDPMHPAFWWPGPFPDGVEYDQWLVNPAGSPGAELIDYDAAHGAQSLFLAPATSGLQCRLELIGQVPLAEILPTYIDFWIRPTTWSGAGPGGAGVAFLPHSGSGIGGTQIFLDGHCFGFFQKSASSGMVLRYDSQSSNHRWDAGGALSMPIAAQEVPIPNLKAREWVRFTARIDPIGRTADVWLNGRLLITDAPRRADYPAPFLAPSFYIQASANGPVGLDAFQLSTVNPLFGDMDSDGLPDDWELANGLNISANDRGSDHDGDGLSNLEEFNLGTLPSDPDSDGDQIPDGWEVDHGFNPLFARDSWQDWDQDGADKSSGPIA